MGAREVARGEIRRRRLPNRQRDETPEARPLRQQCLKRRKRGKHHGSARDTPSTGKAGPMSS